MKLLLLVINLFSTSAEGAELKHGRYIGWIEIEAKSRIAVVADVFIESPEDFTQFPKLKAAIRMSLGGYNTHEYITENFHELKYDFDFGELTFSEEENDLVMHTKVSSKGGRAKIAGSVYIRSSALRGKVELLEESDEPGEDFRTAAEENLAFLPLLEGQYEGKCNEKSAALQVQTIRGAGKENSSSRGLEQHYGIAARLIYKNDSLCGSKENTWCTRQHFEGGTYNFFTGKLNLESKQGSERCEISGQELRCRIRTFQETLDCRLVKSTNVNPVRFSMRNFHLETTAEQRANLPDPAPPQNTALRESLEGTFSGYLHNESNNTYLPIKLDVIPFSSTENPHNPNQLSVSTTASIFLGRDFSGTPIIQRFASRSFYIRPGFMLSGPDAEYAFLVSTWKKGYVAGVWISKHYGRVGTFQLVKGKLPNMPMEAKTPGAFTSEFEGSLGTAKQWIRFSPQSEPMEFLGNTLPFTGSFQTIVGSSPIKAIDGGSFDLITGKFGWWIKHDEALSFGSGLMQTDGNAKLFWPPLPILGTNVPNFELRNYLRMEKP